MNTFVILYHYAPDSQKILEIRPQHREFLKALKDEGKLIGSGPFTDGQGGAL
ncbi:YciI family protein, partial [Klebsiella michiganensis]